MHVKSLLILTTAVSVCAVMSAHGQVVQPTPGVPGDYVLPDGNARKLVQDNCTVCHNLRNIVNSNKSAEDWDNTVNMMMAAGAPVTREQGRPDQSLSDRELSREAAAQACRNQRVGAGQVPRVVAANAGRTPP